MSHGPKQRCGHAPRELCVTRSAPGCEPVSLQMAATGVVVMVVIAAVVACSSEAVVYSSTPAYRDNQMRAVRRKVYQAPDRRSYPEHTWYRSMNDPLIVCWWEQLRVGRCNTLEQFPQTYTRKNGRVWRASPRVGGGVLQERQRRGRTGL